MKTNQHNTIIYFLHNLQIENISRSYKFIKFIFIDRSKDWPKRKKICWHEFCKEFRLLRPRRLTGRGGARGRGRREGRGGEGVRSFANSKRARTRPRLNIAEIESINFLVPRKFRGLRRVNFAHLPRGNVASFSPRLFETPARRERSRSVEGMKENAWEEKSRKYRCFESRKSAVVIGEWLEDVLWEEGRRRMRRVVRFSKREDRLRGTLFIQDTRCRITLLCVKLEIEGETCFVSCMV